MVTKFFINTLDRDRETLLSILGTGSRKLLCVHFLNVIGIDSGRVNIKCVRVRHLSLLFLLVHLNGVFFALLDLAVDYHAADVFLAPLMKNHLARYGTLAPSREHGCAEPGLLTHLRR